jgi:hypothetical protein
MSLWLDDKFLRLLSPHLDRFSQKSLHHYNFRCPLCGDSERNEFKARGYVYPKKRRADVQVPQLRPRPAVRSLAQTG